jgi:GT2 family glycosyltransferase
MNHGARLATGSLLVFLPADTLLPEGALRTLARIDQGEQPLAGGFRMRFDRPRLALRVIAALHNLRARITGIIYGDQALFVRRELFLRIGGFREDTDIEDIELGVRLRRRARPVLLRHEVTTSSRRFDRAGDLRAVAAAAWILFRFTFFRRVQPSRTFFHPVR